MYKKHSRNLHVPFYGRLHPISVVVVGRLFQHTHAALGKVGIVAGEIRFGYDRDFFVAGKLEGTVKAGAAAARDKDICLHNFSSLLKGDCMCT